MSEADTQEFKYVDVVLTYQRRVFVNVPTDPEGNPVMAQDRSIARFIPRTDVGVGGIAALLAPVVLMILEHDDVYNFNIVYALIFGVLVALAGYLATKYKSFVVFVAAPVATLVAAFIGKVFYGADWDNATVSVAFSTLVVALFTYWGPPRNPDILPPVQIIAEERPAPPPPPTTTRR